MWGDKVKTKKQIKNLLNNKVIKVFEKELGINVRNGQAIEGIRKSLEWVIGDDVKHKLFGEHIK